MSGSSYCFDPEIQRKARDYLYGGLRISLCKGIVFFLLGLLVLSLQFSASLENSIRAYASESSFIVALYALIGFFAFWFVSLPFDYYKGYILEHKFELSTEDSRGWLRDNVKISVLSLLVVLVFVEGVYNFM